MLVDGVAFTGYRRYCISRTMETYFMPRGETTNRTIKGKTNDERNSIMVSKVREQLGKMFETGMITHLD